MESFELGSEKLQNFILHDKIDVERSNEWRFRLPWPLFDMTSVKIPVLSNTIKMLNHGLKYGLFLSLFKLIPCPVSHTLNCIFFSLF